MPLDTLTALAWSLDPAALMEDAGFVPDPWQAELLRSTDPRVLLNIHRQGGKSLATAAMSVGEAIQHDDSLILLVSRTQRQSDELFRKILKLYRSLGSPIPPVEDQARMLSLSNGSRIVSLPGDPDNLRSFSAPRLILVDEASRVPDAMEGALSPMLATVPDGRMIYLSTPFGARGFFHRRWEDQETPWRRFEVRATECPRIAPEFLAFERIRLGQRMFAQEYLCEFGEAEDSYFDADDVERAFRADISPLFPGGLP